MAALKQLTSSYPTENQLVEAYSRNCTPYKLVLRRSHNLDINGKRCKLVPGDVVIAFMWRGDGWRVPGVGFFYGGTF